MDKLSRLDLVFCVDLTSSMTSFIAQARAHVRRILDALKAIPDLDLCVALSGYRDHGFPAVLEVHPFTRDVSALAKALDAAQVFSHASNVDAAEAVFAGLDAAAKLPWREGAFMVVVLVGDAPPHACGGDGGHAPDRFREKDPSGWDLDGLTNHLEAQGIFLHALAMVPSVHPHYDAALERAFRRLSISTGGTYQSARGPDAALAIVETLVQRTSVEFAFDRRVHGAIEALALDARGSSALRESLAKQLGSTEVIVSSALMRLRQRGLLPVGVE
ncbi:vWA domain-containing protein [Pyxidicoccus sp. MSG2]|uniref:vWA domain-containing protein n=1 Tax=Pyxidicoccus sp. MSG2 TaxID=2996790 RepID=UPI002270E983|nr:vWA domain-containing protein [Pyxidicoccus sp. MSG2]MCY1018486.1 VWA domain-containing protein [Pyxidicoccus sp. MSG2]